VLKGILKVDHIINGTNIDLRVIYYAEPASIEETNRLKKVQDSESLEARWVSL